MIEELAIDFHVLMAINVFNSYHIYGLDDIIQNAQRDIEKYCVGALCISFCLQGESWGGWGGPRGTWR